MLFPALCAGDDPRLIRRADALPTLLDERDHGLLTSVLSFLQALVAADSTRSAILCVASGYLAP